MMKGARLIYPAVLGLLMLGLLLLQFEKALDSSVSLQASDAPLVWTHQIKQMVSKGVLSWANTSHGLGAFSPMISGELTFLFYGLLPEQKVDEAIIITSLFFTSFFFFMFLRERGLGGLAAIAGALTLGLSSSLVSIASAGHMGKFTGMAYMTGAMWLVQRALTKRGIASVLWAGWMLGCSLICSRDTSFIILLGVGLVWLCDVVTLAAKDRRQAKRPLLVVAAVLLIGAFMSFPIAMQFMSSDQSGGGPEVMNEQQKWEWATQWSLPSDELVKLVSPSYFGWDSWDEEAPYWGSMGQSAGWKTTGQGFRNFTQTNEYLGIVAVMLALIGVGGVLAGMGKSGEKREVLMWGGLALVFLVVSLGKYGFLYRLVYSLPVMSSIRNPVKFMHVVSIALAVLTAHGVAVLEALPAKETSARRQIIAVLASSSILLFFFVLLAARAPWAQQSLAARLTRDGFAAAKDGILATMQASVLRSALFAMLVTLCVGLVCAWRKVKLPTQARFLMPGIIIVLLAADLIGVNKRYVSYYSPKRIYRSNPVFDYLRGQKGYRVKFVPHNWGLFNQWNSLLVPYYFVKSLDAPAESRPPADKVAFLRAVGAMPERYWAIAGVKDVVIPAELAPRLGSEVLSKWKPKKGFAITQGASGVRIQWLPLNQSPAFLVLENPDVNRVVEWYSGWKISDFDQAISGMGSTAFDHKGLLLLSDKGISEAGVSGALGSDKAPDGTPRSLQVLRYDESMLEFDCGEGPSGWVLFNDYFNPAWRAVSEGESCPIVRAHGIFMAVAVPSGARKVTLTYHGNTSAFWVPVSLMCLFALLSIIAAVRSLVRAKKVKVDQKPQHAES